MANNEEGNDSCMYNTNPFFTYIVDGALAQPKISPLVKTTKAQCKV